MKRHTHTHIHKMIFTTVQWEFRARESLVTTYLCFFPFLLFFLFPEFSLWMPFCCWQVRNSTWMLQCICLLNKRSNKWWLLAKQQFKQYLIEFEFRTFETNTLDWIGYSLSFNFHSCNFIYDMYGTPTTKHPINTRWES